MSKKHFFLAGFLSATALLGCSVERVDPTTNEGYYFSGYVYDGVSAETLTKYKLSLSYDAPVVGSGVGGESGGPVQVSATVDASGRYRVGPLKPYSDFTIEIDAENYRSFVSHNAKRIGLPSSGDNQQTDFYEAYLFPEGLETPAVTFDLFSEIAGVPRPSGSVRLVPSNGLNTPSALSLQNTLGGSVSNQQLWQNDNDARNATVVKTFEDGQLTIESSELVYGVTYSATFFGTGDHQYQSFNFTAGLVGSQTIVLQQLTDAGVLRVVSTSLQTGEPNEKGTLVVTFNRPIEFARNLTAGYVAEQIDNNFSINSPDLDADGNENILFDLFASNDPDEQERGTSIKIDGTVLTLSWANKAENFDTQDEDDPIYSVTYGGLGSVELQAVGENASVISLSSAQYLSSGATVFPGGTATVQLARTTP